MLYTWFEITTTECIATWRHYTALALIGVNMMLYFLRYKQAILLTGAILILATFNLLSFFTIIQTFYLGFWSLTTPGIQLKSLLLLVIYCLVNFNLLANWYLDIKEGLKKVEE
jgi:hypothetical protein